MRAVIYKYPFKIDDWVDVRMPVGAEILSLQVQDGVPTIWAKVAPHQQEATRRFVVLATGETFVDALIGYYIGTIQLDGFVWHIFDQGNR
ncbi:hypothetical protein E2A64_10185 [Pseudohoeflea suaedae]|uniref:DUF7352 domain-containing protein n=1 Tax=Pseudohoeflea suaedae TaxID=877384 RepID=A0A4R5PJ75_9HYPH|nr:hypothetical protein [Pseudohoeflea suaedae]TDH35699.1 hypothetical protein E2A64_10185 [Pseudohoeflea suaedae]